MRDTLFPSLLLVGCGNMGRALLHGWESRPPACLREAAIHVIEPQGLGPEAERYQAHPALEALPSDISPVIVLFAVKPQALLGLLPAYAARFGSAPLYLTIAAGKEIGFYQSFLGSDARIVRAMPNTPAAIRKGITALIASANVSAEEKALATELFSSVGKVVWLESEAQMHAVTAVSGSGPAYVFHFMEGLTEAGIALGLPYETARLLAIETVHGASHYASSSPQRLAELREAVTSPNGTTAAGLGVLMGEHGLRELLLETAQAAEMRSRELAAT